VADTRARRGRVWRTITAGSLLVGYAGYYLCRSNLSVAGPILLADFEVRGFDKAALGLISSAGVLSYATGKSVNGVAVDLFGGRRLFLTGMIGSIAATLAFGASTGLAAFLLIWAVNRFVQSMGWGALVKIASHWYSPHRYGTVMGLLSLSFLFGDAAGRLWLGALVTHGAGWRTVFVASAATLAVIAIVCAATLRDSPRDVGLDEPAVSNSNLFGSAGADSRPDGLRDLLGPYVRSPSFWLVCVVSLGLTLIRESFNAWTPTYLVEVYGLTQGEAAQKSSLFPFVGGFSVLVVGALSDRLQTNRLVIAVPWLSACAIALALIGSGAAMQSERAGLMWLGLVAFTLMGPYSLLAGAMAVDLGGRRGSATAAGLIDTAGYLGAVASGFVVGSVAQRLGWSVVFRLLACVAGASALACAAFWLRQRQGAIVSERPLAKEHAHAR
jgi:OPA family glycerol-3-phosphate transporter-like MFS transporter